LASDAICGESVGDVVVVGVFFSVDMAFVAIMSGTFAGFEFIGVFDFFSSVSLTIGAKASVDAVVTEVVMSVAMNDVEGVSSLSTTDVFSFRRLYLNSAEPNDTNDLKVQLSVAII